jgi:hypothetical protein
MSRLFSYVVEHDEGRSPNPFGGCCTLANCKFSVTGQRPNIIELANKNDWIVGTGGASEKSSGHGTIVYAMKVTDKLDLAKYLISPAFRGRERGYHHFAISRRFALISEDFYYFGAKAVSIPKRFNKPHPLEKKGPGFRSDFDQGFIQRFVAWLRSYSTSIHGPPCRRPTAPIACACRRQRPKKRKRRC